jgi:hypothetical protein
VGSPGRRTVVLSNGSASRDTSGHCAESRGTRGKHECTRATTRTTLSPPEHGAVRTKGQTHRTAGS